MNLLSTLDSIENHLFYCLEKAVCYLSRSRKIHKTDEISEMKKFKFMPKKIQPAITCSKLTIETLEQGVKYVQS